MRVGDLVRWRENRDTEGFEVYGPGVILLDHSPMRPPDVGRVVDVLWSNGELIDTYSDELEVINADR